MTALVRINKGSPHGGKRAEAIRMVGEWVVAVSIEGGDGTISKHYAITELTAINEAARRLMGLPSQQFSLSNCF